jgi:hypothetical protein
LEEIGEDAFDGSMPKGKAIRSANYTELKDLHLVKAWEAVPSNAVANNDQTSKKYWQKKSKKSFIVRCQPPIHDH